MDVRRAEERQRGVGAATDESELVDRVGQGPAETDAAHLDGDGRCRRRLEHLTQRELVRERRRDEDQVE